MLDKPSSKNDVKCFRSAVSNNRLYDYWSFLFGTGEQKRAGINVLVLNTGMQERLRHLSSNAVCGRRRKAIHIIFTALGCDCLQSRHFVHIKDEKCAEEVQAREATAHILSYLSRRELIFNHWKCSDLEEISIAGLRCYPEACPVKLTKGSLFLLWGQMAVRSVLECMRFLHEL